jgi:hypothetical protein
LTSADEITKISDALNEMAPAVSAKVLENMSSDELRALAGLKPKPVQLKKEDVSDEVPSKVLATLMGRKWMVRYGSL